MTWGPHCSLSDTDGCSQQTLSEPQDRYHVFDFSHSQWWELGHPIPSPHSTDTVTEMEWGREAPSKKTSLLSKPPWSTLTLAKISLKSNYLKFTILKDLSKEWQLPILKSHTKQGKCRCGPQMSLLWHQLLSTSLLAQRSPRNWPQVKLGSIVILTGVKCVSGRGLWRVQ